MADQPLVTVGVPAYNRPDTLRRALASLADQEYENLEIIVSDDCSPDADLASAVGESGLHNLRFVRQPRNLGIVGNAMWLLGEASGEYFMWLADDDEISPGYLGGLVEILTADREVVTAMGHWIHVARSGARRAMPVSRFPQASALSRAAVYIWDSDDAFFYGLHRTSVLRQAQFRGYWGSNRDIYVNWCYVYLMDVVLRGRVEVASDPSVCWISHDDEPKHYDDSWDSGHWLLRRLNIHSEYLLRSGAQLGPKAALLVPVAVGSLLMDLVRASKWRARAAVRRLRARLQSDASRPMTS